MISFSYRAVARRNPPCAPVAPNIVIVFAIANIPTSSLESDVTAFQVLELGRKTWINQARTLLASNGRTSLLR